MLKTAAAVVLVLCSSPVLAGDSLFERLYGDRLVSEVPSESYAVSDTTFPVDSFDVEDGALLTKDAIYEPPADVNGDGLITLAEAEDYWFVVQEEIAAAIAEPDDDFVPTLDPEFEIETD